jgi:hypothetical protein
VIIFLGLGALLVVIGMMVLLTRRRSAAKQAASLKWPSCDGRITQAVVESARDKDDRVTYSARIAYTYEVNGASLSADRVAWGGRASGSDVRDAEALVARYPVGAAVKVTYNPEKPAEAVLEPAARGGLRVMMIVGLSFIGVGLVFLAIGPFVQH